MQTRIAESAYLAQQAVERGERVVVGVNRFAESDSASETPLQRIDDRVERDQIKRLRTFRASRDATVVERRLAGVRAAASSGDNLMRHFVDAVDANATLGEICDVLRDVFGTYRSREVVA
jgi:methylmalonyl-CoA mutase, N-terminal domain